MSMPAGLAIGAAISIGWTILWAAVLAKLIDTEALDENAVGYGAMLILLTASFIGALLSGGRIKRQRVLVSMASGGIYYLVLIGITALFFGGQYTGMGVTALLVLAGSTCAMLLAAGERGGKKRKPIKMRRS